MHTSGKARAARAVFRHFISPFDWFHGACLDDASACGCILCERMGAGAHLSDLIRRGAAIANVHLGAMARIWVIRYRTGISLVG